MEISNVQKWCMMLLCFQWGISLHARNSFNQTALDVVHSSPKLLQNEKLVRLLTGRTEYFKLLCTCFLSYWFRSLCCLLLLKYNTHAKWNFRLRVTRVISRIIIDWEGGERGCWRILGFRLLSREILTSNKKVVTWDFGGVVLRLGV